ncbi:MAG: metal-dependent hydrolase [Bacteroidota bacterium]|nr:metal-dependent hydrolase [Bacteroidota bacterium]
MDTLTHIVLGACIGEATAGKVLGRKAMVAGALAQSIPDIDFLAYFWLNQTDNLLAHRGITHSVIFGLLVVAGLSAATRKIFHKRNFTWRQGLLLFGLNVFCHLFIDAFNAYGVGWFEPFSTARFSFHVLFVADPFFSIWPFLGMLAILVFNRKAKTKRLAWRLGLGLSLLYLSYAVYNKLSVESAMRKQLKAQQISYESFFATPSPFNAWLWFVIIKDKKGFYTGYRSVFDTKVIQLSYSPINDSLLREVKDREEVYNLVRFAQGYYTVEKTNDTLLFNIPRFGKITGWSDLHAKFAFYYYFDKPGGNEFLIQRGRFKNWNRETGSDFLRRIRGN